MAREDILSLVNVAVSQQKQNRLSKEGHRLKEILTKCLATIVPWFVARNKGRDVYTEPVPNGSDPKIEPDRPVHTEPFWNPDCNGS